MSTFALPTRHLLSQRLTAMIQTPCHHKNPAKKVLSFIHGCTWYFEWVYTAVMVALLQPLVSLLVWGNK
jgi:hypothetical protein